jgi:soluble lytic murein transglycosylase-like protein
METLVFAPATASVRESRRYKSDAEMFKKLFSYACVTIAILTGIVFAMAYRLVTAANYSTDQQTEILELNSEIFNLKTEVNNLNLTIKQMAADATTLESDYESTKSDLTTLKSNYSSMKETIEELDATNAALEEENTALDTQLKTFATRSELYDKYEYALYDTDGKRTDLTYTQVQTGEELMKEKGLDPDLLFGIIMTESNGIEKASNSESTARGYGQMLAGTAKLTYEILQKHGSGTYNHSMAYNGDTNISMVVSYLSYLKGLGKSLNETIIGYRGLNDPRYFRTINSYISKSGNSLDKIAANW